MSHLRVWRSGGVVYFAGQITNLPGYAADVLATEAYGPTKIFGDQSGSLHLKELSAAMAVSGVTRKEE